MTVRIAVTFNGKVLLWVLVGIGLFLLYRALTNPATPYLALSAANATAALPESSAPADVTSMNWSRWIPLIAAVIGLIGTLIKIFAQ
jgi:hypothetical protein